MERARAYFDQPSQAPNQAEPPQVERFFGRRPRTPSRWAIGCWVAALAWLPLHARAQKEPVQALVAAAHQTSSVQLAQQAQEIGDTAIRRGLEGRWGLAAQLGATRACRWMHAPEIALLPLARLVDTRDPDLAPAAAAALLAVTRQLQLPEIAAREAPMAPIVKAIERLERLQTRRWVRPDIRRAVAFSGVRLQLLLPDR